MHIDELFENFQRNECDVQTELLKVANEVKGSHPNLAHALQRAHMEIKTKSSDFLRKMDDIDELDFPTLQYVARCYLPIKDVDSLSDAISFLADPEHKHKFPVKKALEKLNVCECARQSVLALTDLADDVHMVCKSVDALRSRLFLVGAFDNTSIDYMKKLVVSDSIQYTALEDKDSVDPAKSAEEDMREFLDEARGAFVKEFDYFRPWLDIDLKLRGRHFDEQSIQQVNAMYVALLKYGER